MIIILEIMNMVQLWQMFMSGLNTLRKPGQRTTTNQAV